jgi:hypothetical protein
MWLRRDTRCPGLAPLAPGLARIALLLASPRVQDDRVAAAKRSASVDPGSARDGELREHPLARGLHKEGVDLAEMGCWQESCQWGRSGAHRRV